jgi:hypothetical protein
MVLRLLKEIAVRTLRTSGDPQLSAVADWLDNAEAAAVNAIVDLLGNSMRASGRISSASVKQLVEFTKTYTPIQETTPTDGGYTANPFLEQYLVALKFVGTVGCWGSALLLDGFVHSPECSSLWGFSPGGKPTFTITSGQYDSPYISIIDSGCSVFLFDRFPVDTRLALNEEIGRDSDRLPAALGSGNRPKVLQVYEDSVALNVHTIGTKKGRRGPIQEMSVSRELTRIDKSFGGLAAMLQSVSLGVAERAKTLERLKGVVGAKPDDAAPK